MKNLPEEQVIFSSHSLMMFVQIAATNRTLPVPFAEGLKQRLAKIIADLEEKKIEGAKAADNLNQIIDEMNRLFSGKVNQAVYPPFSKDSLLYQVKADIIAFEHYLNQGLRANHLNYKEESPLFNEAVTLWKDVGATLTPRQGVSKLSVLIEKLNGLLPENEKYPKPNENKY